jgi:hypothetical protein
MDTLGISDLDETLRAAARQALHDWGRPIDDLEDLVQDSWTFYLERPSVQTFISRANTETGRRRVFYNLKQGKDGKMVRAGIMSQIISGEQAATNVFRGDDVVSQDEIRDWLLGKSTNKGLGRLIQAGLDQVEQQHVEYREAIRDRFERGIVYGRADLAASKVLSRALKALTEAVNQKMIAEGGRSAITSRPGKGGSASPTSRRGSKYADPTADLALGFIAGGDIEHEVYDGTTTTYRQEFEMETIPIGAGTSGGRAEWLDLFEGSINDRTDMYRAQVFPELYPDEKPMLVENWHPEDREAFVGGEYTPGYRRLRVVK